MLYCLLIITILYILSAIILNKGIPESISETSYIFNKKYYLFTLYCFITAVCILPIWLIHSAVSLQFLCFLSCSGIMFAGASPLFKESYQKALHYISGIVAVIGYVLWLCLSGYWLIFIIQVSIILLLVILDKKNYVFYTEIVGLLSLVWLLM